MIDKNLNKIMLDTKVQMVEKNGLIRTPNEVIFLGNTGSCKSTIARILAGKEVKIHYVKRKATLECEGIKGGNISFTDLPEIINDSLNNLTLIDTPGLKDTKGYVQQIKNAFSIHDLFNSNNKQIKVKIILVIRAEAIDVDRSEGIQSLFDTLDEMFPNLTESDKKAFGIVFTCEIRNEIPLYYIDNLNTDANKSTSSWCEYFKNHLDQVFILPEAKGQDGQLFVYNDKGRLLDFVKKDQLINPKPELTLSNEAKLYLQFSFSEHINDFLQEAGKIFQIIDDLYRTSTDINELDEWSKNLHDISNIQIKSPQILKDAIEKKIVDGKRNFKNSFHRLEDLNALHSFYIYALKKGDQEIIQEIQVPIDEKINLLISKFETYKKLVVEKHEAEQKRKEEEEKRQYAEQKKHEAECKRQEEERKRKEEEEKRQEAERKLQKEKEKRIEKEREAEENRKRLKFSQENNIKIRNIHNETKLKLEKGETFHTESYELNGICHDLSSDQILITSNSVKPESDPYNILSEDDIYYSEDKSNSYICFNFLRRKVKIDSFYIFDAQDDHNCLIHFRVEGSNDANNWVTIKTVNEEDGTTPREAIGYWYTVSHPYHQKEDEYKLYYKYIRFLQTGYSYNSYSYVMAIDRIEFFGNISEPIDI